MAALDRDRVEALAILDVVLPGYGLDEFVRLSPDGWGIWHFPFHASPVAEFLIQGTGARIPRMVLSQHGLRPGAIRPRMSMNMCAPILSRAPCAPGSPITRPTIRYGATDTILG